jgi:hypothetical protein
LSYHVKEKRKENDLVLEIPGDGAIFYFIIFFAAIFYSISSSLIAFGVDGWRAEERDLFSPHTHTYKTLIDTPVCVYVCAYVDVSYYKENDGLEESEARRFFLPRSFARMVL